MRWAGAKLKDFSGIEGGQEGFEERGLDSPAYSFELGWELGGAERRPA